MLKLITDKQLLNRLQINKSIICHYKLKFLSGFALKGVAGAVAGIYLLLIVFSILQKKTQNDK